MRCIIRPPVGQYSVMWHTEDVTSVLSAWRTYGLNRPGPGGYVPGDLTVVKDVVVTGGEGALKTILVHWRSSMGG
jgi:hypothetical protein